MMDKNHGGHQTDHKAKEPAGHEHRGHGGHGKEGGDIIKADKVKAVWTLAGGQKTQAKQDTIIHLEVQNDGKAGITS